MYYNVVIKDEINMYDCNSLVFHFENDFEGALKFAEKILRISNYSVEILQLFEEDNEEE